MDIATAKPSKEMLSNITHYLINEKNPNDPYSLEEFLTKTKKQITINRKNNRPTIICGGTGLFIRAFIHQYKLPNLTNNKLLRKELEETYNKEGGQSLWKKLNQKDPISAKNIHPNNPHHLIRALELAILSGKPPSTIKKQNDFPRKDTKIIGLKTTRTRVIERINERVDQMLNDGFVDEVDYLLKKGYNTTMQSFKALGYQEITDYLNKTTTYETMVTKIKTNTQKFSKRQMTWFKKFTHAIWKEI